MQKHYYLDSFIVEEVANKYKLLLRKFRTRENGPAVDSMNRMGLKYKRNFGIALQELKEFAKEYHDDHEFALFLWQKTSREAKILSLMIAQPDKLSKEQISNYITGVNTSELAEQASLNLLYEIPDSLNLAKEWCKNKDIYIRLTGLLILSRSALLNKKLSDSEFETFFNILPEIAKENNFHIKRGLSRALLQISKRNDILKTKVSKFINSVNEYNKEMASWLKEEVSYYI
ncbi:MAG: DNA alkylation repair protein [Bacteroidota bacterium]